MDTKIIIFVSILIILFFGMMIGIYNSLVVLKNRVKNAYAQIEVQLKRRHDLIPNLIETVKGYMHHEAEIFKSITEARAKAMQISKDAKVQSSNEKTLSSALTSLFAVCENYPDLKASQNFLALQEELVSTENKIGFARQFYNDSVMQYQTKKEIFPNNIFCLIFNFKDYSMFEVTNSNERNVVEVNLG